MCLCSLCFPIIIVLMIHYSGIYSVQVSTGQAHVVSSCQLFIQEDMPLERPDEEAVLPSFVEKLEDIDVDDGAEIALQVLSHVS